MLFVAWLVLVASGFAGLGYQIVWTQQFSLWIGQESAAVLAVVAAFFGGIAVGAALLGRRIESSARPGRWYAACEALIGLWSLLIAVVLPRWAGGLAALSGAEPAAWLQWPLSFLTVFIALLPATAAMGATLPAIARVTAGLASRGASIAALYGANTFGAVLGVLATAFFLLPHLGLLQTSYVCVALNAACALAALALWGRERLPATLTPATLQAAAPRGLSTRGTLTLLALTGLLGIGYEVIAVRVLSEVTEDTVFTFAILLAVYLAATTVGAFVASRVKPADDAAQRTYRWLALTSVAGVLGASTLWGVGWLRDQAFARLGHSVGTALFTEGFVALACFALPAFAMGALFSHLAADAHARGIGLGRALAANTLGAAVAPLIVGVWLTPWIGPQQTVLLVVAGYLAPGALAKQKSILTWVSDGIALVAAFAFPALAFVDVPPGGKTLEYVDGPTAAVSVVQDAAGVATLRINNRQQEGSNATMYVDGRQAWLPLLLHPAPQRALFLGLGTGVTSRAAAQDPRLKVDAVELLPEVVEVSHHFLGALPEEGRNAPLRIVAADARRYVRATPNRYDVIVADNYHPARSGSAALYTVEHFNAIRARLAPGGLFCQWIPLHQLDLATLRSIVRSFMAANPQGTAILASNSLDTPVIGLVSREDDKAFDVAAIASRITDRSLPTVLHDMGIEDAFDIAGSFIASPAQLTRFAEEAPLNTDDHPIVTWLAPRATYAPEASPRQRLMDLLDALKADASASSMSQGVFDAQANAELVARIEAYRTARNDYLRTGATIQPSGDVRSMLAQVKVPLLAILATSPDFRPAYEPLLRMATALASQDPVGGGELLRELAQRVPARPEAAEALKQFEGFSPR